ncbi:MAG: hypothetical protein DRR42_14535 [Gammaproteobacteria bacterium]|nr:MAG: hypothetical protein DRR42_14535 [Gammaproteobacteria bacterium]
MNSPTGINGKPHRRRKSASPLLSRLQPLLVNKTETNIAADSAGVGAENNQRNKLSCEELISILESRKHANNVQGDRLDAEHAPPNGGGVMHQIEHLLAEQSEQFSDLDELDQTVITLVDQLFNQANERKWVPDKLASLFSRIELPTAQLALADQSFFDLDQHPVRRLLNEVASVANSLQAVENLHKDPLGKKLNEVIARLEQQETDIAQLNDLLSDFIKFVETDRQRTSVMEKRVMEEEVAAEKINSARADVEETLGSRLLGVEYGYCLVEFVEKAWSRVMFRASLKYGIGSEPWTQVVHLLDQLLGLESMEEVEAEFLGHLLDVIGESLSDISYDPYEVGRMFANIRRYFLEEKNKYENVHPIILDKSEAQLTGDYSLRVRVESVDVEIPGESVIPDKELVGSVDDNLLTQIESLKKGVWVELGDDAAAPAQRCRLLGIVEPSGKYVFGDRNGRKAAVASRYRLAVKMKEGKLIVLDNSHLFDEALADVIRDATQKSRTKNTAV